MSVPVLGHVRRSLIALALAVALVASTLPTAPATAAPLPAAWLDLVATSPGAPAAAETEVALIEQAARLWNEKFFEPVDSAVLFKGGLTAANEELASQKSAVRIPEPQFNVDFVTARRQFADAYNTALTGAAGVDQKAVAYATLRGMATALNDCHTTFLTPEQKQQLDRVIAGNQKLSGLGITIQNGEEGYVIIGDVYSTAPAFAAGLRPGDTITAVNGEDVKGLNAQQVVAKVRGPAGESVTLTVRRAGRAEPIQFTVTRAEYQVPVWDVRVMDGNVGYIRLYSFAFTINRARIQEWYKELREGGATRVVIDLRNNGGGSANAATELLSTMIPRGQPLYSFISRDGSKITSRSTENLWADSPPVAILINRGSASASEIVAAVAQDFGVAKVFGEKTEGCVASVEYPELADGSAVGVTTTRVDTAKGRSLNRVGVAPDVDVARPILDLANGIDRQLEAATGYLLTAPPAGSGAARPTTPPAATTAPAGNTGSASTSTSVTVSVGANPTTAATTVTGASVATSPATTTTTTTPTTPGAPALPQPGGGSIAVATTPPTMANLVVPAGTMVRSGNVAMALEAPDPNATLTGQVQLGGWAAAMVDGGAKVEDVTLTFEPAGGTAIPVSALQYGLARPDVAKELGGAGFANSGFSASIDTSTLPPGEYRLTLRARAAGKTESYTIPVRVGRGSIIPALNQADRAA